MWKRILESIVRFVRDVMAYGFNDDKTKYEMGDILGNFATVENGSTASRPYWQGHLLVYNKHLYRVIRAIAEGDAFVVDQNIKLTNVGQEAPAVKYISDTLNYLEIQSQIGGESLAAGAFKNLTAAMTIDDEFLPGSGGIHDELKGFFPVILVKGFDFIYHGMISASYTSWRDNHNGTHTLTMSLAVYNPENTALPISNSIEITVLFIKGSNNFITS